MKGNSASPQGRADYCGRRKWKRFPPTERCWEEMLRGESPVKTKGSPRQNQSLASFWEGDLNEMIAYSIAQMKKTRVSVGSDNLIGSFTPEKRDSSRASTVDVLSKAAEDVKTQRDKKDRLNLMMPTPKNQVMMKLSERSQRQSTDRDNLRVETEPMQSIAEEEDLTNRVLYTEEPAPSHLLRTPGTSPTKRLQSELRRYREKCKRLEAMYALLLQRTDREDQPKNKQQYEELKRKHERDARRWEEQKKQLSAEIERLRKENQELRSTQLSESPLFLNLKQEVEAIKQRISKTERDNEELSSRLPAP